MGPGRYPFVQSSTLRLTTPLIGGVELMPNADSAIIVDVPCWSVVATKPPSASESCTAGRQIRTIQLDVPGTFESDEGAVRIVHPLLRSEGGNSLISVSEHGVIAWIVTLSLGTLGAITFGATKKWLEGVVGRLLDRQRRKGEAKGNGRKKKT